MNGDISSYKRKISKHYNREAHAYVGRRPWIRTYILLRIINFIKSLLDDNRIILNVGCGPGWLERLLADTNDFVSIDVPPKMVELATKCSKTHALIADGEHLPFRSGSFDVIITSRSIKFMNPESLMKEVTKNSSLNLLKSS